MIIRRNNFINCLKAQYYLNMGQVLNITNPQKITEKLQWLKIYDDNILKSICSDKIEVRNYCKNILKEDLFIPILKIFNNVNDIDFNKLPEYIALKCNHGSGYNIIGKKSDISFDEIYKKFSIWLNEKYAVVNRNYELFYNNIKPKAFLEEYKQINLNYKFFVFNGEPKLCQLIYFNQTGRRFDAFVDMNFKLQSDFLFVPPVEDDLLYEYYDTLEQYKPVNFNEMISIAKTLSKPFKFVRIDFYEINGKIYLSELTFIPSSGYFNFKNKNADYILGSWLNI